MYLIVAARDASVCKAFRMVKFMTWRRRDGSMRSHIHGRNRNRIALHVVLNGSRNCARR